MMDRWAGRVALVTGASSGIGAAIAKQLVSHGMIVVGAARRVERIHGLSKELEGQPGSLLGVKCDVTKDEDIYNLFKIIKEKYGGVDVCINNAGMAHNYTLMEGTPESWRYMLEINVVALCLCTKLSLESMKERGIDDGHVIHISSTNAFEMIPDFPQLNFYCATKHAVKAVTEGLRLELKNLGSKNRISSISPGWVKTEVLEKMLGEPAANEMSKGMPFMESEDIAASVCHLLAAPPHVNINDIVLRPTGGE